jgi:hypothetical protein
MVKNGYGNGLNGFYLDPEYARNGKFYTTHIEDPKLPGSNLPDNAHFPALNVSGYTTTAAIKTPGPLQDEGVLVEWTDTNPSNSTFEGTAPRAAARAAEHDESSPRRSHLQSDARRGDPDWRVLYIECGDGASANRRTSPSVRTQRLDNLEGKILRIIPDLAEHTDTSTVSENGRYRIPQRQPVRRDAGRPQEIWAYGFPQPAPPGLAVDPANPPTID